MAEEVTERAKIELTHNLLEAIGIPFLNDLRKLFANRGVRRHLHDRFGEESRVRFVNGPRRPAEFQAKKNAFFTANPLANKAAPFYELQSGEIGLKFLRIACAKCVVDGGEDLFIRSDLSDGSGTFKKIAENVEIKFLVSHNFLSHALDQVLLQKGTSSIEKKTWGLVPRAAHQNRKET